MRTSHRRQRGFTVVELLTVVAIIAILASIVFPIAGSVKNNARRSQAISNLRNVGQSLGLYKLDERAFPPALGPYYLGNSPLPISHLSPEYLKNPADLRAHGPLEPQDPTDIVPVFLDPNLILDAGAIRQLDPSDPVALGARFEKGDAMDGFWRPMDPADPTKGTYELRYTRYRPMDPSDPDYKRQLRFRYPPEDTVVTWISQFRTPNGLGGEDLVLFMNGEVQKFPVSEVARTNGQVWRIKPRQ